MNIGNRILFLGDIHGNKSIINMGISYAISNGCTSIIQVGDFGYFPNLYPEFITYLNNLNPPIPIYFIDGNHDDHWNLPKSNEPVELFPSIFYIPRGYIYKSILFLGGASSIDKHHRTIGIDWWPEEEISYKDYLTSITNISNNQLDILITHTSPSNEVLTFSDTNDYSNRVINNFISTYRPRLHIHGHHHYQYELKGETTVIGLGSLLDEQVTMSNIISMSYILDL
jgi:predicted MPP superfamily phosphohydrolase